MFGEEPMIFVLMADFQLPCNQYSTYHFKYIRLKFQSLINIFIRTAVTLITECRFKGVGKYDNK